MTVARTCFFCGRRGSLSKEHVWPRWIQKYVDTPEPTRSSRTTGFYHEGDTITIEPDRITPPRQGSVLTFKVRIVCERCNNGWMSKLESQAKPILRSLISDEAAVIEAAAAATLATWAVKTAWMNEHLNSEDSPTTTVSMRAKLMRHLLPPYSLVWLARHNGLLNLDLRRAGITVLHQDDPQGLQGNRRAQMTSIVVRPFALLVWTVDGWGVPPPRRPAQWAPLWPSVEGINWRALPVVSDEEVLRAVAAHCPPLRMPAHTQVRRLDLGPEVIEQA